MNTSKKRSWLVHWTARRAAHAPVARKPSGTRSGTATPAKHDRLAGTLLFLAVLAVLGLLIWHAVTSSPPVLPDTDYYYYWLP